MPHHKTSNPVLVKEPLPPTHVAALLFAPNGKLSNLTPAQYYLVRTPAFKAWFGDWQNNPANSSKVVDENGEPLVVYHGSNVTIKNFRKSNNTGIHGELDQLEGIYFTDNYEVAEWFASNTEFIRTCFMNLRNPLFALDHAEIKSKYSTKSLQGVTAIIEKEGYDGIILKKGFYTLGEQKLYLAFQSNQLKLADGSNSTFDLNNPDIRFAAGGEIQNIEKNIQYVINKLKPNYSTITNNAKGRLSDKEAYIFEKAIALIEENAVKNGIISFDETQPINVNYETTASGEKKVNVYEIEGYTILYKYNGGTAWKEIITPAGETIILYDRKFRNQFGRDVVLMGNVSFDAGGIITSDKDDIVTVYHATASSNPVLERGINVTSSANKKYEYAEPGYVYVSAYPQGAYGYAKLAYPDKPITVYAIHIKKKELLPDSGAIITYKSLIPGLKNTLESSLNFLGLARIKRPIYATEITEIENYAAGGEITSADKMYTASSRFRPRETIIFHPAITGPNGAILQAYTWQWMPVADRNAEGDEVMRRISDWTQAEISADTGRMIVHQYDVKLPDGSVKTVSSESVPALLGYEDHKAFKTLPNITTIAKTLAKQKMQLAIMEVKHRERQETIAEIEKLTLPEVVEIPDTVFGRDSKKWQMGDATVYEHNAGNKISKERYDTLKSNWQTKRLVEKGFKAYEYFNFYELKNRIARQERKLQQALQSAQPETFAAGGSIETEAFKKWFEGSKVVDNKNKPLVVYHGSPDLRGLKTDYVFKTTDEKLFDTKDGQNAYFFTDSYKVAKSYADPHRAFDYQNAEEGVMEFYLSLKNPLVLNANGAIWRKFETEIDGQKIRGTKELIKYAHIKGYDGVIVKNVLDFHSGNDRKVKTSTVYTAFYPHQIKLLSNTTFDANNADIRFAAGGEIPLTENKVYEIGKQLKRLLKNNKSFDILNSDPILKNSGWTDGGCYLLANTLQKLLGGKLKFVVNQNGLPQHVFLEVYPYRYLDWNGTQNKFDVQKYWLSEPGITDIKIIDFDKNNLNGMVLGDPETCEKLYQYLLPLKNNFSAGGEIIAYHGTTDKPYRSYQYKYFTADVDYAKEYAGDRGRILKAQILINNPFHIEAKYMGYGEIVLNNKIIGFYRDLKPDVVEKLKSAGYDGITVNYPEKGKINYEIIPFSKEQIIELDGDFKNNFKKGGAIHPSIKVFTKPTLGKIVADTARKVLPQKDADKIVDAWKREALRIGQDEDRSNQVVISMFDFTGAWSKPYIDAGYTVLQFDIQHDTGIWEEMFLDENEEVVDYEIMEKETDAWEYEDDEAIIDAINTGLTLIKIGGDLLFNPVYYLQQYLDALKAIGKEVVLLLSATPCTTFAGSGARWWPEHDAVNFDAVHKRYGWYAAKNFDSISEYNETLVRVTEEWIVMCGVKKYAMENPIGRIAKKMGLPEPTLQFNPNIYGDPYTKKTQLWGKFNPMLPQAPVIATEGSKIQSKLSSKQKVERSTTPTGFSYAFFIANMPNALPAPYNKQYESGGMIDGISIIAPTVAFHGTSSLYAFDKFSGNVAYFTTDIDEAELYAVNTIVGGGKGKGEPRIIEVMLPGGKIKDIDTEVQDCVMEGDDLNVLIDQQAKKARNEGFNYLSFYHPGVKADDFQVIVSLYPHNVVIKQTIFLD